MYEPNIAISEIHGAVLEFNHEHEACKAKNMGQSTVTPDIAFI